MFYKNTQSTKKLKLKKLSFGSFKNNINANYDESVLPINYPKVFYNVDNRDGTLKTGMGIGPIKYVSWYEDLGREKEFVLPIEQEVLAMWTYRYYSKSLGDIDHILIFYCADKKMYRHTITTHTNNFYEIGGFTFSEIPTAINYNLNGDEVIIFSTPKDGTWVWSFVADEAFYKIEDAPNITSMTIHYERLFATVISPSKEVWFSDDLDVTNWSVSLSEAGFIQMVDERGKLLKVISLNEYVYVFREFGISKISAFGDQSEFSVTHPYITSGRIFEKTIVPCGDKVFFLSQDGICVFDGYNVTKLDLSINKLLRPNHKAVACYNNGKYYISMLVDFNDGRKVFLENLTAPGTVINNALLELDIKSGEIRITRGISVEFMAPINGDCYSFVIAIARLGKDKLVGKIDDSGNLFDWLLEKGWETPFTDFGYSLNDKVIKEVRLETKKPFYFVVETEKEKREFHIPGKEGESIVKIAMRGRKFKFFFDSRDREVDIKNVEIVYGVL